jgi:hypothetical protein
MYYILTSMYMYVQPLIAAFRSRYNIIRAKSDQPLLSSSRLSPHRATRPGGDLGSGPRGSSAEGLEQHLPSAVRRRKGRGSSQMLTGALARTGHPIHGANSNDSMPDRPVAAVLVRRSKCLAQEAAVVPPPKTKIADLHNVQGVFAHSPAQRSPSLGRVLVSPLAHVPYPGSDHPLVDIALGARLEAAL